MTAIVSSLATQPSAPTRSADVATRPLAWLRLPSVWKARAYNRRALAGLDARQLRDVGIDPDWVRVEIVKPFWVA